MIVASGHQPNLLPGLSVIRKLEAADIFIWCDRFQAVRHGWFNRNRLADGTPLLVPMDHRDWGGPISDVRIGDDARWRRKLTRTLELKLGAAASPYRDIIERPYERVIGLNAALLRRLCRDLEIDTEWTWQSHLEAGRGNPLRAHSQEQADLRSVSERLALLTAELGADVWLSGPSGRSYLDETPFHERGLQVEYFDWAGDNFSAIQLLRERQPVPA
jgi:WbqC-like protein family